MKKSPSKVKENWRYFSWQNKKDHRFVWDAPKWCLLYWCQLRKRPHFWCIPNKNSAFLILFLPKRPTSGRIRNFIGYPRPLSQYFLYKGGDLTNTKQRQSLTLPDSGDSDWKKADKRFLWNYHMGSSLLNLANSGDRSKVAPFLVLLIHGGVYIHRCSINGVRIFIKISNFHFNIQFLMLFFLLFNAEILFMGTC